MIRKSFVIIFTFIFITLTSLQVFAGQLETAKSQKNSIQNKISDYNSKKKEEEAKLNSTKSQNETLLSEINKNDADYKAMLAELNQLEEQIKGIEDSLDKSEQRYNEERETFKKRLRVLYKNSKVNLLETLVSAKDLNDLLKRIQIISLIGKKDNELIGQLQLAKEEIAYVKTVKESKQESVKKLATEKKVKIDELKVSRSQVEARIKESSEKIKWYEEQEDKLLRQSQELANLIKNLQSSGGKYTGGTMTWPTPSGTTVSSPFGSRYHPILKKWKMHTGIDISVSYGKSIVAANNGTVIFSGWQDGYGNTIIVDHGGGITTLYAHASKLTVDKGDKVKAGDEVAKVGSTGLSTGPHLHFEVRKDGEPQNPLKGYLSK